MHSHVLPMPPCTWMAVSHTVRALRAAYALATAAAALASAGSSASTAHAAYNVALSAPSDSVLASASRCWTAWNEPIGDAVLAPLAGVVGRQRQRTLHRADEIGRGQGDGERFPGEEVGGGDGSERSAGIVRRSRGGRRDRRDQAGEVDTVARGRFDHGQLDECIAVGIECDRRGTAGRVDRESGPACQPLQIGGHGNGSLDPVGPGRRTCTSEQIMGEDRAGEGHVAGAARQRSGDERRFHTRRQRVVDRAGAQLTPAGLGQRHVESRGAIDVVEIADGGRPQFLGETSRSVFELTLLGRRSGIHHQG